MVYNFVETSHRILKMHQLSRKTPVLRSIFIVLLRTGYWMEARLQKYTSDCRIKANVGQEPAMRGLQEGLTRAACQVLKRRLRTPITEFVMSVDLFTAVDATGIYNVHRDSMRCPCSFSIDNGLPCRHILACCTHSITNVNVQSICDSLLQSDTYLTHIAVENYFTMQVSQPNMKNTVIALVMQMSEEQCCSLYSHVYQELHGRLPPTPLNLQAEPQLYTEIRTSTNVATPSMH
ncbi:unnamed protein product [Schistosoma mattheei]|uniref:SWIM-type domain-containing protein n=1 Tax=Schistosoma mattheei TaxID=31246 RepID=A0AA85BGI6_9TREM|nr:unnamed protein product [Schistosoma mattheei]